MQQVKAGLSPGYYPLGAPENMQMVFPKGADGVDFPGLTKPVYEFMANHPGAYWIHLYLPTMGKDRKNYIPSVLAVVKVLESLHVGLSIYHYREDEGRYEPQHLYDFMTDEYSPDTEDF